MNMFQIMCIMLKKGFAISLIFGLCFIASYAFAEDEAKIRILFVYGGHPFEEPQMDEFLNSFPELEITKALMPEARNLLKPGLEKTCDVVVFYDMDNNPVTDEQKANYAALLEKGIGIFAWHHHHCSNQAWDEYIDLVGGRTFLASKPVFRGKEYPMSTFIGGLDLNVKIAKEHPITKGVKDFTIHDEGYGKLLILPDAEVLLTCDHENQNFETCWIWRYGKSTIVANLLGHDSIAWKQPEFRQLFIQSIHFLADEKNNVSSEK
ncbi:MAG: ThuA domain-containing protein [Planctomycetia bacterium]|nr:ThuA domain-containing protein [Planctomycetia bacterium]